MFVDPYQIRRAIRDGISITAGGAVQLSAGTTSSARSDFTFSNSNGVSFGLNGVGVITASVAPAAGGLTNIKVSAGILSELRSDITFSNANGVTFGLAAGGVITASVAPGGAQSTQPVAASASNGSFLFSTVGFSNANGVTFGTSAGNIITASVATNYQTPGAYLTTAALSQDSSLYAGTGITTTTTAGTAIVGTMNTSGLSLGIPAYLTTAAVTGAISALNISAGTTSSDVVAVTFSNGSGVTFGYDGTNVTASVQTNYQTPGAYLTTAQPPGAYLTTAALSQDSSLYAGTGFTSTTTAGTAIVATLNTSGLSMGIPAYLTTGAAFTPRLDQVLDPTADKVFNMGLTALQFQYAGGGSFSTNATRKGLFEIDVVGNLTGGADIVHIHQSVANPDIDLLHIEAEGTRVMPLHILASASTGIQVNYPIYFTTDNAAYPIGSVPFVMGTTMSNVVANLNVNYLQGRVSTQFAGLGFSSTTTAGTDIKATLSTNGLSMAVPVYLTVAAGGGGVAISNSQTLFSTGTVAFSAAAGGAMTIASSAGGQSLIFSVPQTSSVVGSGMISIATAGSTINISAPNTSSIIGNNLTISTNVSTISISAPATSSIVGLGGISISTNGSTITISYSSSNTSAPTLGYFENQDRFPVNTTTISASGSVIQIVPFLLPQPLSMAYLRIPASFAFASTSQTGTTANTSFTVNRTYTIAAVIYTNAGGNMSQIGYYKSSYASFIFQTSVTAGANGSEWTLWNNVTYPVSGVTSSYATSYAVTSTRYQVSTGSLSLFTGLHYLDIPFATSLSAGNYWLGIGGSNNTASNAGPPTFTGASMSVISMYAQSQTNLTFILAGAASASSVQMQVGLGSFSTNAAQESNATVAMSNISMQASNPKLYFQMIWST